MCNCVWRALLIAGFLLAVAGDVRSATLEKLTVDEMAQQSTLIVRGRVGACSGEARGQLIYTRCRLAVSELWKGAAGSEIDFYIPGGTAQGLRQVFSGAPSVGAGAEYVLFLWAGRSGINQVIGLSQGVFGIASAGGGQKMASRAATSEMMLDKSGTPVTDTAVQLSVSELKTRVTKAVAAEAKQ